VKNLADLALCRYVAQICSADLLWYLSVPKAGQRRRRVTNPPGSKSENKSGSCGQDPSSSERKLPLSSTIGMQA